MTSPPPHPAPVPAAGPAPSTTLRRVTRVLAGLHLLGGIGLIVVAVALVLDYRGAEDGDSLAGLGLFVGVLFAALGVVVLVLAGLAVRVSGETAAYALGLATGLVSTFFTGAVTFVAVGVPFVGTLALLLSLGLAACSLAGLVRQRQH